MKTVRCKDLGGPQECDHEISGETFDEIGKECKTHVMEQLNAGNEAHTAAVADMQNKTPEEQQILFNSFEKKFNETPKV